MCMHSQAKRMILVRIGSTKLWKEHMAPYQILICKWRLEI